MLVSEVTTHSSLLSTVRLSLKERAEIRHNAVFTQLNLKRTYKNKSVKTNVFADFFRYRIITTGQADSYD